MYDKKTDENVDSHLPTPSPLSREDIEKDKLPVPISRRSTLEPDTN